MEEVVAFVQTTSLINDLDLPYIQCGYFILYVGLGILGLVVTKMEGIYIKASNSGDSISSDDSYNSEDDSR